MSKERHAIDKFERVLADSGEKYYNFWLGEEGRTNSAIIVRYIIEEKFKIKQKDILPTFTVKFMKALKLGGMLEIVHNNNLTDCLFNAYPNFKPHCRFCNAPFEFVSIKNFYCSDKCKERYKYENRIKEQRAKNQSKGLCIYCGLYKIKPGTKYCNKCADSFKRRFAKPGDELDLHVVPGGRRIDG